MRRLCLVLALVSTTLACSDAPEATASPAPLANEPPSDAPLPATDAGSTADAAPPLAPCDAALPGKLQADIDATAAKYPAFDFLMTVKTPSCGLRTFSAGPHAYDESTLEIIGSASKTYVAAAILKLVETGALSVDDPASKWLPGIPQGPAIRVKHLLRHESGIADYFASLDLVQSLRASGGGAFTPKELTDAAFRKPLAFTPGAKWSYSNTNYIALGMIAEAVAKKPLAQLVRDLFFTPLGLTHSFFDGAGETVVGDVAVGIEANGSPARTYHPSFRGAAGGVVASLPDVATWFEALCSGKVVAPASEGTYVPAPIVPGWSYGYGLVRYDASITHGGGVACGHAGNWYGYQTETYYFHDSKTTVIATVNGSPAAPVRDVLLPAVETTLFGGGK